MPTGKQLVMTFRESKPVFTLFSGSETDTTVQGVEAQALRIGKLDVNVVQIMPTEPDVKLEYMCVASWIHVCASASLLGLSHLHRFAHETREAFCEEFEPLQL